jgi:hypothetical protein
VNLARANEIIDKLSETLVSQSYIASRYIPFSSVGVSSRLELAHALYLTTAQVFQEANNGKKVTVDGDGSFEAYLRGTSGILFGVLWMTPCLPDSELSAISRLDMNSTDFFVESSRLNALLEQDSLKKELETMDSFVSFIRTLNRRDPEYWYEVYRRIRLEPESNLKQECLREKCWHCGLRAGEKHTLYKKTETVRAGEVSFEEYRKKTDPKYRPGREEFSDYFWHCKQCARALGPDYQGDPDEDGNCHDCSESAKAWKRQREITIQAAGGIEVWERKKFMNKILAPVDYFSVIIGGLSALVVAVTIIFKGVFGLWLKLSGMWESAGGKIFLILGVVSLGWCAFRWKAINEKPTNY